MIRTKRKINRWKKRYELSILAEKRTGSSNGKFNSKQGKYSKTLGDKCQRNNTVGKDSEAESVSESPKKHK